MRPVLSSIHAHVHAMRFTFRALYSGEGSNQIPFVGAQVRILRCNNALLGSSGRRMAPSRCNFALLGSFDRRSRRAITLQNGSVHPHVLSMMMLNWENVETIIMGVFLGRTLALQIDPTCTKLRIGHLYRRANDPTCTKLRIGHLYRRANDPTCSKLRIGHL